MAEAIRWEPWKDYQAPAEKLPIEEPPCKACEFWAPMRKHGKGGSFEGVRCCVADKMFDDFSCFRARSS